MSETLNDETDRSNDCGQEAQTTGRVDNRPEGCGDLPTVDSQATPNNVTATDAEVRGDSAGEEEFVIGWLENAATQPSLEVDEECDDLDDDSDRSKDCGHGAAEAGEEFDILTANLDERPKRTSEVHEEDENGMQNRPFERNQIVWGGHGDAVLTDQARLFPASLPFISLLRKHAPQLLPGEASDPGIMERLLCQHLLGSGDEAQVKLVRELWREAGGNTIGS